MLQNKYYQQFEKVYKNLNPKQKEAVDSIEGPVMVIAGPGTGKTQILAARIANILLKTDVNADNILCLTYTDSGAVAMLKRLNDFIGPVSYRINIFTFHAFCNQIIQENQEYFGYNQLDPVSELEQIQIIREIIDELPSDNPLKRFTGDYYYEASRLLKLYVMMKQEDLTTDMMLARINEYVKSLETREGYIYKRSGTKKDGSTYKKGDLNLEKIADETKKMELLAAACKTFNTYQQKLLQYKRYDFDDMILWVIDAFNKNENLRLNYQEKYQYVLVDEFQDTSGSQNEVLNLLLAYWDEPNVFVVGDDDQSIYRFQGANVENIQKFKSTYLSSTKTSNNIITLTDNYRSSQTILNSANAIITNSSEGSRIIPDKKIVACNNEYKDLAQKPMVVCFENTASETVYVANSIMQQIADGVKPSEIAVLYREHRQSDELIQYLRNKGVSISTRKKINVLDEPVIKKLLTILKYLHTEIKISNSGENYLFEILHYNEFDIPAVEIAQIAQKLSHQNNTKNTWREALSHIKNNNQPDLFDNKIYVDRIYKVWQILEQLIKDVPQITLQQLIFEVINRCGLFIYAMKQPESDWQLNVINTFFNFVKSETLKNPALNLDMLLKNILLMQENRIGIYAEQLFSTGNGVNFITAHSSKGLEFEYVYLIGCTKNAWDEEKANRGYKLPDNLILTSANTQDESRRLFYVAMTRAKKFLHISYSEKNLEGKDLEPSVFISELKESNTVESKQVQVDKSIITAFYTVIHTKKPPVIHQSIIESLYLDEILSNYSLSVTHLNNYLKCPLKFFFINLIRVPAPKNPGMSFGSAVHFALEKLFRNMLEHPNKLFDNSDKLIENFLWYMKRHKDSFQDEEFVLKCEYGKNFLPKYVEHYKHSWNKVVSIEKTYRNIPFEGVLLNGKIDKIEFNGNYVNVVDYKTGQYKKAKSKFKAPDSTKVNKALNEGKEPAFEDLYGGDYWRQAVFYKFLIDFDSSRSWIMHSSEFDFVEPDSQTGEFKKELVQILPEHEAIVKEQILDVYAKIKNKEFTKGCGKDDCDWCAFAGSFYNHQFFTIPNEETEND